MFFRIGNYFGKNLGRMSLVVIGAGLISGWLAPVPELRVAMPVFIFCMLYPAMLRVELSRVGEIARRPTLPVLAMAVLFVLAPLLIYLLSQVYARFCPPEQVAGLILYGLMPCGPMVPAYTAMLRGDVNTAVVTLTISLLCSIVIVPLWAGVLLSQSVQVDSGIILLQMVKTVVVPLAAAEMTRRLIVARRGQAAFTQFRDRCGALTGWGFMGVFFTVFHTNSHLLLAQPLLPLVIWPAVASFVGVQFGLGYLLMRLLRRTPEDTSAFLLCITARNNAIAIALATAAFGGATEVVTAITGPLCQFPIMLGFQVFRKWQLRRTAR
ncbi:MAG: arsenic resistance protein [Desulfovibrionaceae bacterium]